MKKESVAENSFYNPYDNMAFTYNSCFLCGTLLEGNKSVEHVFPKWVQHKYRLWNQNITLLNGTTVPYRKLTIPCCSRCNTNHLAPLENKLKEYHGQGYRAFLGLDRLTIFQWMTKIFLGLLFKELFLSIDRKDSDRGSIISPQLFEGLRTLHGFLQSVRAPFNFANFRPWSIFIFEIHVYSDERDFDYYDGIFTLTFSIRLGEIGIIACLGDNGVMEKTFSDYFSKFKGFRLHPMQFEELVARVVYKSSLVKYQPKYTSFFGEEGQETVVMAAPLQGYSSGPIFEEWSQRDYARILARLWRNRGKTMEEIYIEPDLVWSSLFNEDGSVNRVDSEGDPIVE